MKYYPRHVAPGHSSAAAAAACTCVLPPNHPTPPTRPSTHLSVFSRSLCPILFFSLSIPLSLYPHPPPTFLSSLGLSPLFSFSHCLSRCLSTLLLSPPPPPQHTTFLSSLSLLVECCFTSTETVRIIRDGSPGRPPRLSHSS